MPLAYSVFVLVPFWFRSGSVPFVFFFHFCDFFQKRPPHPWAEVPKGCFLPGFFGGSFVFWGEGRAPSAQMSAPFPAGTQSQNKQKSRAGMNVPVRLS
jgi:hypothetical protein